MKDYYVLIQTNISEPATVSNKVLRINAVYENVLELV
jgi:hypothetical protein